MKLNAILFLYGVLIAIACMLLGFALARIVDPVGLAVTAAANADGNDH